MWPGARCTSTLMFVPCHKEKSITSFWNEKTDVLPVNGQMYLYHSEEIWQTIA